MSSRDLAANSYDAGQKPYLHDPKREKWEGKWDFFLACFTNSFGMRSFFIFSMFFQTANNALVIIPIIVSTLCYIIPIFFVQSFMGQFSSTGFISVFRISPLFKGIGYVTLILNFFSAIYNSSITSYPLLYFLKSFQFNTTWMYCDNSWNTPNCSEISNGYSEDFFPGLNGSDSLIPCFEYFFHEILKISHDEDAFNISWTVILSELVVWILVGYFLVHGIKMISKCVRYNVAISASISIVLFIRVCCLPEIREDFGKMFSLGPNLGKMLFITWIVAPMATSTVLGRGWGVILTLASYQPFKANTELYSCIIPFAMMIFTLIFGFMLGMIDGFVSRRSHASIMLFNHESIEYFFIVLPYYFGKIEASQMWSMLFYLMFFLSELTLITLQAFAIVTALVDEYAFFRSRKRELSIGLCVISFLLSTCFATEHLTAAISALLSSGYLTQTVICFLEVIILVWIYGRERFLRDVSFMLRRALASWKFYILRFVTPAFIAVTILLYAFHTLFNLHGAASYMQLFVLFMKGIPWIFIPGYIIAKLITTIGTVPERIRRCTRPNDWYPADPVDKQKYDLACGSSDASQQLLEMNDSNVL